MKKKELIFHQWIYILIINIFYFYTISASCAKKKSTVGLIRMHLMYFEQSNVLSHQMKCTKLDCSCPVGTEYPQMHRNALQTYKYMYTHYVYIC